METVLEIVKKLVIIGIIGICLDAIIRPQRISIDKITEDYNRIFHPKWQTLYRILWIISSFAGIMVLIFIFTGKIHRIHIIYTLICACIAAIFFFFDTEIKKNCDEELQKEKTVLSEMSVEEFMRQSKEREIRFVVTFLVAVLIIIFLSPAILKFFG